jgi:hypothetical protein
LSDDDAENDAKDLLRYVEDVFELLFTWVRITRGSFNEEFTGAGHLARDNVGIISFKEELIIETRFT